MTKKRLSKGQQRRVAENQAKRLNHSKAPGKPDHKGSQPTVLFDDNQFAEPQEGIVISRFGKQADVEGTDGKIQRCHIRRTLSAIVTGDHVIWRASISQDTNATGIIEALHPRKSLLTRPDIYDGLKPVAANIDQVFIVNAPLPMLSLNVIDRYLISCETMKLHPIILLNKIDLLDESTLAEYKEMLSIYTDIGYQVVYLSSYTQQGYGELLELLKDKVTIFAGQSGVGKSSLLNQLLPDLEQPILVNDVSDLSGLGQHTTTSSRLYHLSDCNGKVIDSPGIREFGLWHLNSEAITQGFIEFHDYLGGCKFRDCKHADDPGCLIRKAVENGKIHEQRYESYHKILESIHDAKSKRHMNIDDSLI